MSLPPPATDSTVLVTGASSGIGAELARELARRGYGLTLVARRKERLTELADESKRRHGVAVDVRAADLSKPTSRTRLIAALHAAPAKVVGVCNNAGFGSFGRFQDLDLERETEQVRLNVDALHELTGAFLPDMVARGAGAVLNLGSVAGFQPMPANATYAATKAFVNSFSEAVHSDLAGTGVSCTALCPGPVRTEFGEAAGLGDVNSAGPDFLWLSPEEVARAGVRGMIDGKRAVIPGAGNRVAALGGRHVPRTLLLPLWRMATERSLRALQRDS
jgi:short-subunit dehydrogenase